MAVKFILIKFSKVFRKGFTCFIIFLFVLNSCTKDKTSPPVAHDFCDSVTVKFQSDILPVMNTYCTFSGCHGAGSGMGDFTNYSGVKSVIDNGQFENRVLNLKDMPPAYSPGPTSINSDDLQKIECWIKDGAQNN